MMGNVPCIYVLIMLRVQAICDPCFKATACTKNEDARVLTQTPSPIANLVYSPSLANMTQVAWLLQIYMRTRLLTRKTLKSNDFVCFDEIKTHVELIELG